MSILSKLIQLLAWNTYDEGMDFPDVVALVNKDKYTKKTLFCKVYIAKGNEFLINTQKGGITELAARLCFRKNKLVTLPIESFYTVSSGGLIYDLLIDITELANEELKTDYDNVDLLVNRIMYQSGGIRVYEITN